MSNPSPQDFTPIVFNGGHNTMKNKKNTRTPNHDGIRAHKIEENAEEGNLKIETVSLDLQTRIKNARLAKKLTQKDLAKACNLPANDIQRYENGTAIPNQSELNKMSRILGVGLSNKKKN